MKNRILSICAAFALLLSVSAISHASSGEAKVMVVKFHSDWCGTCRALEAPLKDLKARFDGQPVSFVIIDFTDDATQAKSKKLAEELGITAHLKENGSQTGLIRVIDADSKELRAVLTLDMGADAMAAEIAKALE